MLAGDSLSDGQRQKIVSDIETRAEEEVRKRTYRWKPGEAWSALQETIALINDVTPVFSGV